ncbi:Svf1-like-domain-containing protein [Cokeromyces recurvatus]|uniref:Svf1-like-domain-containing protein n=1 Tax=Cokeromyces recurvatus TaxID=90255 RepID=UPI00221FA7D3|nr:Svf1-like-domain-containing protein [Cokeromyces recurvatus]KAI7899176.1 Svf1-like-domain-containing protein [Cokeromyces recurvatus]
MSSWFSQLSSTVSNVTGFGSAVDGLRTVADTIKDGEAFTPLNEHDLEWTLASGSSTENQVFYITTRQFMESYYFFTCRFYDPPTNTSIFKNINMSSKFELSSNKRSGKTYLGKDAGFVSHKFWPRAHAQGTFIINQTIYELEGDGMFVHAIQGMQPQLIASTWNFANFHSDQASLGMMQFQTTKQYGSVHVNQARWYWITSSSWSLKNDRKVKKMWSIEMVVEVKNLIDKIDILAEIPYVIRKLVQTFFSAIYLSVA